VAAGAILIVHVASRRLLRSESEFRIALAALDIAGRQQEQKHGRGPEPQDRPKIQFTPPLIHRAPGNIHASDVQ
jgi:hypothetical protein